MKKNIYLTAPQFNAELEKCLQCPSKPCMKACPVSCSPHDFIAEAKKQNWHTAAELITEQNVLGEVCGLICPDYLCMKTCLRQNIDYPIKIPQVQAYIMQQARYNNLTELKQGKFNGKKVAVIGLGPAGIGAIAELLKAGFKVEAFEKEKDIGGALNLIPQSRLPREILAYEWQKISKSSLLTTHFNENIANYPSLLKQGISGIIIATGEQKCRLMGIKGEENAILYTDYLRIPEKYKTTEKIAVIGGGAVAVDCAITAKKQGAENVEMFVRRKIGNMRITSHERAELLENDIDITTMTRVVEIKLVGNSYTVYTTKTQFDKEGKLIDIPDTKIARSGFRYVIYALGSSRAEEINETKQIIYAGDISNGGSTAVQAIASGKEAVNKLRKFLKV